jgi:hypothetical protein
MVALIAVAMAVASVLAGNVTVGRFYKELAKAKQLGSVDEVYAEANLRGAGFKLPELRLDKSLTEADMTSISNALGLVVTTERPSQLITESQLSRFMASFSNRLGAAAPGDGLSVDSDNLPPQSGNGRGKKKGHHKSGTEPL